MKKIVFVVGLLFSIQAFLCPSASHLAGRCPTEKACDCEEAIEDRGLYPISSKYAQKCYDLPELDPAAKKFLCKEYPIRCER